MNVETHATIAGEVSAVLAGSSCLAGIAIELCRVANVCGVPDRHFGDGTVGSSFVWEVRTTDVISCRRSRCC
jgi:hypothetical protein